MDAIIKRTTAIVKREHWQKAVEKEFIHLIEEVGELANAIRGREGHTSKPARSDIADSICDVLWHLIIIADHYTLDLPKEYMEMVDRMEERIKKGEFHHGRFA